jgi:predicted DsbA family dithiol-disulfide isomerase
MARHPNARDASRAFLCAQAQGKGDEMAAALFQADDLTPQSCERLARSAGVSIGQFRACLADPGIDQRIDADLEWVKAVAPRGLPVIWVQDRMLSGIQSSDALREALWAAERDRASPAR